MNIDELLEKIEEVIKAETEPINKRLDHVEKNLATKQDIQRLEQKMDKEAETIADLFHETWRKMETTNERITRLDEAADLTHKN